MVDFAKLKAMRGEQSLAALTAELEKITAKKEMKKDERFWTPTVDKAGNVREAAGGISNAFTLARSYLVETYTIPNFVDAPLFFNGNSPQLATRSIALPADLSTVNRANFRFICCWRLPNQK